MMVIVVIVMVVSCGDGCGNDGNCGHYGGGSNYSCDLVMVSNYPNVNHRSISEALTLKAETRTTTLRC